MDSLILTLSHLSHVLKNENKFTLINERPLKGVLKYNLNANTEVYHFLLKKESHSYYIGEVFNIHDFLIEYLRKNTFRRIYRIKVICIVKNNDNIPLKCLVVLSDKPESIPTYKKVDYRIGHNLEMFVGKNIKVIDRGIKGFKPEYIRKDDKLKYWKNGYIGGNTIAAFTIKTTDHTLNDNLYVNFFLHSMLLETIQMRISVVVEINVKVYVKYKYKF